MTNITVHIPESLQAPLQEYKNAKNELQVTLQAAQEMQDLAAHAPKESGYEPITQLTTEGTPPLELDAAYTQLTQALKEIEDAQKAIELKEHEIEGIRKSAQLYTLLIIGAAILIIGYLVYLAVLTIG